MAKELLGKMKFVGICCEAVNALVVWFRKRTKVIGNALLCMNTTFVAVSPSSST